MTEVGAETRTFNLEKPIPSEIPSIKGWKEVPIVEPEKPEPLVPLGPFSDYDSIFTSSIYFGQHENSPYLHRYLEGSMPTIFAREGVAKALKEAGKRLPKGMYFVAYDAYRPMEVQQALYDTFYRDLKRQHSDWSDKELAKETQKFVSLPASPEIDPDCKSASPHNTGGAIDIAISILSPKDQELIDDIDEQLSMLDQENDLRAYELQFKKNQILRQKGKPLNFGTKFDHGGPRSALRYYEELSKKRTLTVEEAEAQKNRRLLYNIMTEAGFQAYEDEWWHFNSPKSQMGAIAAGVNSAEYGHMHLSEENIKFDKMIRQHELNIYFREKGAANKTPHPGLEEEFKVVVAAVNKSKKTGGGILKTSQLEAEVIKPEK